MSNENSSRPSKELLPCPFCGAPAQQFMWDLHYGCSDSQCGAYMANLTAEQWNRRAAPETNQQASGTDSHSAIEALWELMCDGGEDATTGDVTMEISEQRSNEINGIFWRLGGKYRRTLEETGWEHAQKANACQCDPNPSIGGSPPCPVHDGESEGA